MEQKKTENFEEVKELTDEEVENAEGGMKIVIDDQPSFLRTLLRFFFGIKG